MKAALVREKLLKMAGSRTATSQELLDADINQLEATLGLRQIILDHIHQLERANDPLLKAPGGFAQKYKNELIGNARDWLRKCSFSESLFPQNKKIIFETNNHEMTRDFNLLTGQAQTAALQDARAVLNQVKNDWRRAVSSTHRSLFEVRCNQDQH